jgi:hypothetical protein
MLGQHYLRALLGERVQHAVRPDVPVRHSFTVGGCPAGIALKGHYRRSLVRWFGHSAFTFLRSFAPPELPGFIATMNALTPVRAGGTTIKRRGSWLYHEQVSLLKL